MTASKTENLFKALNYPEAPKLVVKPPGPKAQDLLSRQRKVDSAVLAYPNMIPLAPVRALGATVMDADGNVYVDLTGGIGVLNAGHSNPEVVQATVEQAGKISHVTDFPGPSRVALSEKLVAIAPGKLRDNCKVFLCGPTGADAIEAAVKLARFISKRPTVISFEGGWHGNTGISLSASGKRSIRADYLPVTPEIVHAPYAYCYHCQFGMTYPSCDMQCAKFLEHLVRDPGSGATSPGAILVEPIQGEGGIVTPPPGYLQEIRRICDAYDLIFILDEIQTGFGRTGSMFACELAGVDPDILCISKTLGGGLPNAAILIREDLDLWSSGAHVGTFRGNLISAAAGLAAIDFIIKNNLDRRSAELGERLLARLQRFAEKTRHIGDVRGQGLFIGLEFVKDKQTREPYPSLLQKTVMECFNRGVIVWKSGRWNNVGRIMPSLVINEEQLEHALSIFEEAHMEVEQREQ